MVQKDWVRNSDAWNVDYLSGYLNPDPATSNERQKYKEEISNSKQSRVASKFTELFRGTNNLQIMFSDFLGINKTYNVGGQDSKDNWKLRVDNDFEDDYYRALQDKNSYALNMPEILGQAVRAKKGMAVAKVSGDPYKANQMRNELDEKLNPLLGKLDSFSEILKEKEEVKSVAPKKVDVPKVTQEVKKPEVLETKKEEKTTSKSKNVTAETTLAIAAGVGIVVAGAKKLYDKFKHRHDKQQVA